MPSAPEIRDAHSTIRRFKVLRKVKPDQKTEYAGACPEKGKCGEISYFLSFGNRHFYFRDVWAGIPCGTVYLHAILIWDNL